MQVIRPHKFARAARRPSVSHCKFFAELRDYMACTGQVDLPYPARESLIVDGNSIVGERELARLMAGDMLSDETLNPVFGLLNYAARLLARDQRVPQDAFILSSLLYEIAASNDGELLARCVRGMQKTMLLKEDLQHIERLIVPIFLRAAMHWKIAVIDLPQRQVTI
jgi:Ulp1 family protease